MRSFLITTQKSVDLKETSDQSNRHQTPAIFEMYPDMFIKGTTQSLEPNFAPFKDTILITSGHCEALLLILFMAYESFLYAKDKGWLDCIKHHENRETLLNNGSTSLTPKLTYKRNHLLPKKAFSY